MKLLHEDGHLRIFQIRLAPLRFQRFLELLRGESCSFDSPESERDHPVIFNADGLFQLGNVENRDGQHVLGAQHVVGPNDPAAARRRDGRHIIFSVCSRGSRLLQRVILRRRPGSHEAGQEEG